MDVCDYSALELSLIIYFLGAVEELERPNISMAR